MGIVDILVVVVKIGYQKESSKQSSKFQRNLPPIVRCDLPVRMTMCGAWLKWGAWLRLWPAMKFHRKTDAQTGMEVPALLLEIRAHFTFGIT
jgi:hypothetical protein